MHKDLFLARSDLRQLRFLLTTKLYFFYIFMQWRGTAWLRDMLRRAETTPFYEWHAWIRAELRDLKQRSTSRADDDEDEVFFAHSTSAAEVVMDLSFLSEKDIGILMDSGALTAYSRAHTPSVTTTSKRAILRNWLLGGAGGGGRAGAPGGGRHVPGPMQSEEAAAATAGAGLRNLYATNLSFMLVAKPLCY
jgi:hypothetical protein